MDEVAYAGDCTDKPGWQVPDVWCTTARGGYQCDELIGGEGLVVGYIIDADGDLTRQELLHDGADVGYGGEGAVVVECPKGPGEPDGVYFIKEVEVSFVARTVDHGRTEDVPFQWCFCYDLFGGQFAFAVGGLWRGGDVFSEFCGDGVGSGFDRAEEDEGCGVRRWCGGCCQGGDKLLG